MTAPGEPCRTCRGTRLIETAAADSRAIHYEPCSDCAGADTWVGGSMTADSTLCATVDSAARQLAVVVSSLESTGNAALYRSALEAHAYTSMLRAEPRAHVRWARETEQAQSMLERRP